MNSSKLTDDDVRFLIALCAEAGELAVSMREGVSIDTKTSADDLVTCADKKLSELIVARLSERFPDDIVLSEEAPWQSQPTEKRRWIIDPIDGTKYYVDGTGKWCVMIGLVENCQSVFGCFYMPHYKQALAGGGDYGAWHFKRADDSLTRLEYTAKPLDEASGAVRMLVSNNDLKAHPWIDNLTTVKVVRATSIGLDVFEIWQETAEVFAHIRPTLKYWDTAATAAVAQGLGLEVGTEDEDGLVYGFESPSHQPSIVIGKPGSLAFWRRLYTKERQTAAG